MRKAKAGGKSRSKPVWWGAGAGASGAGDSSMNAVKSWIDVEQHLDDCVWKATKPVN
jgi:hypothetical protein